MAELNGQCMCGAVTVRASACEPVLRACHCDMCRRWTSGMFLSVSADPESIEADGPVRSYRSSDWAERAFCDICGSALWYMTTHDNVRNLAAGLFENAAGGSMTFEFYSDRKPRGYALAGDHRRLTEAECLAMFAPEETAGDNA
ncbi:GFA family protein [Microbulbifer sp. S227A]|uniref:GFA family protein n=1 Tax=Microbulbifer sp. S227A TaxID=3415131 RepID=UPI003C7A9B5D